VVREPEKRKLPLHARTLALLCLAAGSAAAQQAGPYVAPPDPAAESARREAAAAAPHLAERFGVAPLAHLGAAEVEAADRLAELAAWNRARRQPRQIGFARLLPAPRRVELGVAPAPAASAPPAAAGAAASAALPEPPAVLARGGGVLAPTSFTTLGWGGTVRVDGAHRLRLHLSQVALPAGARLWVHGAGLTVGPFGEELRAPDGSLWTPSVPGEEVALDVEAPAAALAGSAAYGFTLDAALELVRPEGMGGLGTQADSSGCVLDATCFSDADFAGYDAARHAVALLEFAEDFVGFGCTGTLLNDSASDGTPFLLTAHHCISTQTVAASLEAFFDDYTPSCNGTPPALSGLPTAKGSTLLVTGRADTAPDFTLLRLHGLPGGRTFLGWDAAPRDVADGAQLFRISHPEEEAQSFSKTRADPRGAQCTLDNLPLSRFIYSDLEVGTVEPGSSGSAAMLADGRVVGQLFGSCGFGDPCSSAQQTLDGGLFASFAQLQPFLSPGVAGACVPGDFKLCLGKKRFQVQVTWENQFDGSAGVAHAVAGTDEAGFFYFTDPSILELIVKILDFGTDIKVFYGELTNLRFTITVADARTGLIKTYTNTRGDCGGFDGSAFPAGASGTTEAAAAGPRVVPASAGAAWPAPVEESRRRSCGGALCLAGGRFAVGVHWSNPYTGASGTARARALSDTSGLFTFTDPSDVELVAKVVEYPNRTAFFYAALSNFEYDITIADAASGSVKTYHNPALNYCGGFDNTAFPP
jgi:hypothetical protein